MWWFGLEDTPALFSPRWDGHGHCLTRLVCTRRGDSLSFGPGGPSAREQGSRSQRGWCPEQRGRAVGGQGEEAAALRLSLWGWDAFAGRALPLALPLAPVRRGRGRGQRGPPDAGAVLARALLPRAGLAECGGWRLPGGGARLQSSSGSGAVSCLCLLLMELHALPARQCGRGSGWARVAALLCG